MPLLEDRTKQDLGQFLIGLKSAIESRRADGSLIDKALDRAFADFRVDDISLRDQTPIRVPACRHLETAYSNLANAAPDLQALVEIFKRIEPLLVWEGHHIPAVHAGATTAPLPDHDYADTFFVGPGRLIPRKDLLVGATIMGPNVLYPDHRHPPEEIYIALSQGAWRQDDGPWNEPGVGGLIYNPHRIVHAMRSQEAPLLAIWCLPLP